MSKSHIDVHWLIGYCRSASSLVEPMVEKKELKKWVDGLLEIIEQVAIKIDLQGDGKS